MADELLLTPGPTPVPERARLVMAEAMMHHRTAAFTDVMLEVRAGLQYVFETEGDVLALTTSGTGAFEAAMINFTRRSDTIISVGGGKFGERWSEIGRAYGMNVVDVEVAWGQPVEVDAVARALEAHPDASLVTVSASETSTGVFHPVQEIAALVQGSSALLAVDGITAVGVHKLPMDAWGIDLMVGGSQKAFAVPPGLGFVAASERAWERYETADHPRYYLDLGRERKKQAGGQTAFTPAVTIALALREVLRMMREEGLESVHARHALHSRATRAGLKALGMQLLTDSPSHAVTAARVPEGLHAPDLVRVMRERHGIIIAGGQEALKPSLIRFGHLGFVPARDVITGLAALENSLTELGRPPERAGAGVLAAQAEYDKG